MLLSDLIADLRLDLSDSGAALFEDPTLERCVRKAVFRVGKDRQINYSILNGDISPTPDEAAHELMAILAQVHACQVMRAATTNAFSFSSGDKRVDKTSQPGHWAKLEADLMVDYRERLYGSDDATYGDIAEISLELDENPPEELPDKIDAMADVLPDADVLGEDRLVTDSGTYKIQSVEPAHFFGAVTHKILQLVKLHGR